MAQMSDTELEQFLSKPRQAVFLSTNADGSANGVPVWFDWDGEIVRLFSASTAPKVARVERDPRISLLVTNDFDEAPAWVRFDGRAEIDRDADAKHLAIDVLAPRYWDLSKPDYAAVVDSWRGASDGDFVVIRLRPDRTRSNGRDRRSRHAVGRFRSHPHRIDRQGLPTRRRLGVRTD